MEDFSFGPDLIDVNTSNSLLQSICHSDSSLMEVEMPPTVQPQEKIILKHLQPVQEQNYSNFG